MKRTAILLMVGALLCASAAAQNPTGDWILQKVDANIGSDNKISHSLMIIHGRRGSRTVESRSWIQGEEKSFTEYLAPPREAGTKMLKLEDQLWTYSPSTDRTIKISGHMLRQSVMGSDLSYEDLMEDRRLTQIYDARVVGEEEYDSRPCWTLELTATEEDVAYYSRKIWVDKERFLSLKEDRFAKSGKLLKRTEVVEVERIEGRWIPKKMVFRDMLKAGEGTEFVLEEIEFNADIPDYVFSKASLRR
jgi:outer membrane lipoprotein-sorting protein